jgi:hypothetical protein
MSTSQVSRHFGVPPWRVRKVLDALAARGESVPRVGPYRAVPPGLLPAVEAELRRCGLLPAPQTAPVAADPLVGT